MLKAVQGLIGLVCATALFWVGVLYEHRPAGWPNIEAPWSILGWRPTLHLPDGPVARLDALLAADRAAAARAVAIQARQSQITVASATHDATAQAAIRVVYRSILQKVPVYVTAQDDRNYPLSWGFVRLHDASALGVGPASISLPAGAADDAASTVKPSALATAIGVNYEACHLNAQQLTDLQDWIRQQQLANPPAKP